MKRRVLICVTTILLCLFVLNACSGGLSNHIHVTEIIKQIPASCTRVGYTQGSYCKICGETLVEQEEIPLLSHTEEIDPMVYATSFEEGLTEGSHCVYCDAILVKQEIIPVVPPLNIEFPYGTVTTKKTVINTKHLKLNVPKDVFLPDTLVEDLNLITSAMERVSGLTFEGNPKYDTFPLPVDVVKLPDTESELGPAYSNMDGATVSSGDLINLFALIHECSHSLQYNQSRWLYCTWMMESISTYTTYKTQVYIEEKHPELIPKVDTIDVSFSNYGIENFEELYKHPIEYWMNNTFDYSVNQNYSIGFAFAWYLDDVYGNYTKWITAYEKSNPHPLKVSSQRLSDEEQLRAFRIAYGDDVFDGFYPWLKEHEDIFDSRTVDMSSAKVVQIYPEFVSFGILYEMPSVQCKDLIIDLSAGKKYMTEYKGRNIDGMKIDCPRDAIVEFYDSDGNLLRTEIFRQDDITVDGVSFIRVVGECEFWFKMTGFDNEYAEATT